MQAARKLSEPEQWSQDHESQGMSLCQDGCNAQSTHSWVTHSSYFLQAAQALKEISDAAQKGVLQILRAYGNGLPPPKTPEAEAVGSTHLSAFSVLAHALRLSSTPHAAAVANTQTICAA